jgi:23S rRNA pseudouridine2605 synthase
VQVRLQKFLADAGIASRRAGEQLILDGRVTVNGQVVLALGAKVSPGQDKVAVDGRPVRAKAKTYLVLHKPRGYVCTRADEQDRPTVMELLPPSLRHLHPVGRLDFNSEGLLFLTNDGSLTLRLSHPRHGVRKKYVATLSGRLTPEQVEQVKRGIFSEGEKLSATSVRLLPADAHRSVVEIELTEGRNREVRRMFEALGLFVKKLVRTQIGPVELGRLASGRWRTLTGREIGLLLPPP